MKRIRIIEDDDAIRTELKTLLTANGYQPVEQEPCDLILMDVNLPGESGFTLCRKLRQTSDTPVIFLTARDQLCQILLRLSDHYYTCGRQSVIYG